MGEMRSLDMDLIKKDKETLMSAEGKESGVVGEAVQKQYNTELGKITTYEMTRYDDGQTKEIVKSNEDFYKERSVFYGTPVIPAVVFSEEQIEKLTQIQKDTRKYEEAEEQND